MPTTSPDVSNDTDRRNPVHRLTVHLLGLVRGRLWVKILIGMGLGLITGLAIGPEAGIVPVNIARVVGAWLALPGQLFLALIQMIVIPLVFASIIVGIAGNEDLEQLKRVGPRIVAYFMVTTTLAIVLGVGVATIIRPGRMIDGTQLLDSKVETVEVDTDEALGEVDIGDIPGRIVGVLPQNPLRAMSSGEMLQVVLFAIIFGAALAALPANRSRFLMLPLATLQDVCMRVVKWAMLIAPLAVFGLLANVTSQLGFDVLAGLGVYILTVLLGLLLLVGLYMLILMVLSRYSPRKFMRSIREVQLLAFSTASSAAVMPLSMETAEEKLGVPASVARFIIPLGATINMDGTALYQGAATVFLAQVFNVNISPLQLILVVVTVVGASIGTPATPGVGIIILATVLSGVGIPPEGVALIIGVDRILDMTRTAVNVTGDLTACTVMARWSSSGTGMEEKVEKALKRVASVGEPAE
ncbi:MAG TPA: dicarboxylate/amino acid:cation symporter [candidate division WOR-3 bacterium]|uniref:Dicarboxylate/amino acid:cation symporter n=1 Tax=candidate division WOR-3 bacterium TaxID=2052148 RepID=A0A7V0T6D4_UNCW3|nr:dicarboxylate/amino acid:cation symporter [candidate division WOR-3 bacterium]